MAIPLQSQYGFLLLPAVTSYKSEKQFNQMLASLGENITYQIAELPGAYDMFLPENRSKYDVLVFYHMWQKITDEQAKGFCRLHKRRESLWLHYITVSVLMMTGLNILISSAESIFISLQLSKGKSMHPVHIFTMYISR